MLQAEIELAAAKPPLIAAQEAVNCLDKASLIELRSFNKVSTGGVEIDKYIDTINRESDIYISRK